MTNVSKKKLKPKTQKKLFSQFTKVFVVADETKLASLFSALFTEAEKEMFIKRVAIILMFHKGLSMYAIARSLRVSETTVRTHRKLYETGHYDPIVVMVSKKTFNTNEFLDILEVLLRGGMPSYGKDRWKALRGL